MLNDLMFFIDTVIDIYFYVLHEIILVALYNESTLFKKRPGEEIYISVKNNKKLKKLIKKLSPPILLDLFKKISLKK